MPDVFIDSFGARWQDPPPPRYRAAVQTVLHLHGHLVPRTAGDGLALPWTHPAREQEPTR